MKRLAAALLLALTACGGGDSAPVVPQTAPVTVSPAGHDKAPALRGTGFDGAPVEIAPGDGRAKLLVFVAHWCPHCRREVPRLVKYDVPHGVDLYAISTSVDKKRPNYPPSDWLAREGWTAPVLRDDAAGTAAEAYGLEGFPYFVAVRADGTIAARVSGELDEARFNALVGEVL